MAHDEARRGHREESDGDRREESWRAGWQDDGDRPRHGHGGHDDHGREPATPAPDPEAYPGNVVLEWNRVALDAIRDASIDTPPEDAPYVARALAMESIAMFDTLRAIEGDPGFLTSLDAPDGLSSEAAVSAAAHAVLAELFPNYGHGLDRAYEASLAAIPDGAAEDAGVAFGREVADAVIAARADDGSYPLAYLEPVGGYAPGEYRPTPPDYTEAIQPHWGDVRPFVLGSGDQFRPGPPPGVTTAEYAADLAEVRALGGAESDARTPEQAEIALWWSNDEASYTRVGQWSEIADGLLTGQGRSPLESAYLLTELNVGLADALIACWDAKYAYDAWRPVTAIREADADGNRATSADPDWLPLLPVTPDHPEYASGHSVIGGLAEVVMTDFFGAIPFSGTSETLPGVVRHFDDFAEAAREEADSRIYAGVHLRYSTETGLAMGEQVGEAVTGAFDRFAPAAHDGLLA